MDVPFQWTWKNTCKRCFKTLQVASFEKKTGLHNDRCGRDQFFWESLNILELYSDTLQIITCQMSCCKQSEALARFEMHGMACPESLNSCSRTCQWRMPCGSLQHRWCPVAMSTVDKRLYAVPSRSNYQAKLNLTSSGSSGIWSLQTTRPPPEVFGGFWGSLHGREIIPIPPTTSPGAPHHTMTKLRLEKDENRKVWSYPIFVSLSSISKPESHRHY